MIIDDREVIVNVTKVDWVALRHQKAALLHLRDNGERFDELSGLIHLLDDIQDQAADQIGSRAVFGRDGI